MRQRIFTALTVASAATVVVIGPAMSVAALWAY